MMRFLLSVGALTFCISLQWGWHLEIHASFYLLIVFSNIKGFFRPESSKHQNSMSLLSKVMVTPRYHWFPLEMSGPYPLAQRVWRTGLRLSYAPVLWHKGGCGARAHQRTTGATISEHPVASSSCLTVSVSRFLSAFNLKVLFLANAKNREMDLENIWEESTKRWAGRKEVCFITRLEKTRW